MYNTGFKGVLYYHLYSIRIYGVRIHTNDFFHKNSLEILIQNFKSVSFYVKMSENATPKNSLYKSNRALNQELWAY